MKTSTIALLQMLVVLRSGIQVQAAQSQTADVLVGGAALTNTQVAQAVNIKQLKTKPFSELWRQLQTVSTGEYRRWVLAILPVTSPTIRRLRVRCEHEGFVNDTTEIARRIGDRMTLFSNIDPVAVLQDGSDDELEAEIRRQVEAGRAARGFIISTASPITPGTPLARVRRFIELAKENGSR